MNSTIIFSNNQEEEYSDLLAISGTSFLLPDQTTESNTSNTTLCNPLIHLSPTPHHQSYPSDSPSTPTANIIDRSISAFDILPAALTPSTPSSRKPRPRSILSPSSYTDQPSPPTQSPKRPSHTNHNASPDRFNQSPKFTCTSSNLIRTQSADLIALHLQETPRASMPRSKSTTSVLKHAHQSSLATQHTTNLARATKSILKRPNSPSKRARARFFSPRLLSSESSQDDPEADLPGWVDQSGNLKAREVIHEFQYDQPPNKLFINERSSSSVAHKSLLTFTPPKVPTASATSRQRRHSHTPRFTIPEPIDLGIEPILPRRSTSPSPSPPPLSPSSYLVKLKPHHPQTPATEEFYQHESNRSTSTSLLFNTSENLSNILDQSAGFLVGNDTTLTNVDSNSKDRPTELSIDLNHVAMLEILAKQKALNPSNVSSGLRGISRKLDQRPSRCLSVPEEDDSVDVCGLAKQLEETESSPLGNLALNDEQAPMNLQGSLDFSSTFELSSKFSFPPLLTHEEEIWKNSIPNKPKEQPKKNPSNTHLSMNSDSKFARMKTKSMPNIDTLALSKKIEGINLCNGEQVEQGPQFQIMDDLFSELMSAPPPSSSSRKSPKFETNGSTGVIKAFRVPAMNTRPSTRPSARPSTAQSRLSGPIAFPSKPIDKPVFPAGSPVSKSRTSCVSTSRAPVGSRRGSNIGIGLPSSSSAPNITKLSIRTPNRAHASIDTDTLTGTRTKLKPSSCILKPHSAAGSPRLVMKNRSSISNQNLNLHKMQHSSPKSSALLNQHSPTTKTKVTGCKVLKPSMILNLPATAKHRPSSSSSDLSRPPASRASYISRLPNPSNYQNKRHSQV